MEFPILRKKTNFGIVPDVKIPLELRTKFGYQTIAFLLDTGADFTMLPNHIATDWLDIDLNTLPQDRSYGIEGGKGIMVWRGKIQVKICKYALEIRCLFSENQSCPYILGRADIFSQFNIFFDNTHAKIKLTKINPL